MPVPCLPPARPAIIPNPIDTYGVPRGTLGRAAYPIRAIVVHCLGMNLEQYRAKVCDPRAHISVNEHASIHYGVGYDGDIRQFVDDGNVAWGMQSYNTTVPVTTPASPLAGWSALPALYPNLSADFYTLQIGIAAPYRDTATSGCSNCCAADQCATHPFGLSDSGYRQLVQLIAYKAAQYSIPIDDEHIELHDRVVNRPLGQEECQCTAHCLICDVSNYCQTCESPAEVISSGVINYVYGESVQGCKVKMTLPAFKALLATV
jgi:N-acetylmuramoyl-L-alanine amidase